MVGSQDVNGEVTPAKAVSDVVGADALLSDVTGLEPLRHRNGALRGHSYIDECIRIGCLAVGKLPGFEPVEKDHLATHESPLTGKGTGQLREERPDVHIDPYRVDRFPID